MNHPRYAIADTSGIYSPALIFFVDLIRQNLARTIEMAGGVERLRLHAKTHKTPQVVELELAAGVRKHKVATLAEAEMVAACGAPDILLAYPMVGPNILRLASLIARYPQVRFSTVVDHPAPADALSRVLTERQLTVDIFLDVDVGQHRTGIAPGAEALALYERVARLPGLRPAGLHVYDGHNHQESIVERRSAVLAQLEPALRLREQLTEKGLPVATLVVGGTPTFPVYAHLDIPGLECSPGTLVLHDNGYGSRFADLSGIVPAAVLLTRVISRPTPTRVTFDLGYKAVASDPPAGKRLILLDLPEHEVVLQNEEHLVIETLHAGQFSPGDEAFAIPTHICPTVAMHQRCYVVEAGKMIGTWEILARDRVLGERGV